MENRFDLGIFGGTKIEEILEVLAIEHEEETQEILNPKKDEKFGLIEDLNDPAKKHF